MPQIFAEAAPGQSFGGRKVIDVDTHLSEPYDLWTSRAPASLKDRVPRVKQIEGKRSWVIDSDIIINEGANPSSCVKPDGKKWQGLDFMNKALEECHPASYDVKARVRLIDDLGVSAQIIYPNILGFGGQHCAKVDTELRVASVRIYNDAMAEYQEASGQRMFPMALLPWWDAKSAAAETERAHNMGLRGININSDPQEHVGLDGQKLPDLGSTYWDPLWEVCTSLNMSVNFHIGASDQMMDWFGNQGWPGLHYDLRMGLGGAMLFINNSRVLANLIYSGVIDRFEKLQFVSVESGIGWAPFMLEALDMQYMETGYNQRRLKRLPSEYFKTNFFACFWFERKNLATSIRQCGVDNVLFETDFPHPICLYPIDDIDTALGDLTEEEKVKVLSGNAGRLYNIKV